MNEPLVYAIVAMVCYGLTDFIYKQAAAAGIRADHFLMAQGWLFCPLVIVYALASLTIVRVLEHPALKSLGLMPASTRAALAAQAAAVAATEEAKARRDVEAAADELRRAGWTVDIAIRYGAPLQELLAATKTARAQLLAVGARGHGPLERLLLGSVAEGALHRAPVSVLVVR